MFTSSKSMLSFRVWAALIDRGLVIPGTDKSAVLVRVNGAQQRLMRCKVEILSEDDSDAAGGAREVEEVPDSFAGVFGV